MSQAPQPILKSSHLLGIEGLSVGEITALLDLAEEYVTLGRAKQKKTALGIATDRHPPHRCCISPKAVEDRQNFTVSLPF